MTRKLRAVWLVLVATAAATATMTTAAHAEFQFTGPIPYADMTLTGEQLPLGPNGFTLAKGAPLSCKSVTYHGTTTGPTGTLAPTYKECEMYKEAATVTGFGANACDWHLVAGKVDLKCAAGKDVEIDTTVCTITIRPQAGLQQYSWKQGSDGEDVDFTWALEKIEYEYIGGFSCEIVAGVPVATIFKDGKYEGVMTLEDEDRITKKQVPLTIDK